MNEPRWSAIADNKSGKPILTVTDIMRETSLKRRTVRGMITRYQIRSLPRYSDHDALRYLRQDLITTIARMPGSGAHNRKPARTRAVDTVTRDYLSPALEAMGLDPTGHVYGYDSGSGVADVDPDHPGSGGTGNDPPDHHHKAGGPRTS